MALLHLDHVRVRSADVIHKCHITSVPIYMHRVCGVCLWIFSVRCPALLATVWIQRSLPPVKKDFPLCPYSLVLHLGIAAFLLPCCGSFGMDHVNLCTVKKARIKNAFLTFGSYQDSKISLTL